MSIAKWRQYSKEQLQKIVASSQSSLEVAQKLGYTYNNFNNTLQKMYEELQIDTSHFQENFLSQNEKICAQCGEVKNAFSDYYSSNGKTRAICKECVKKNERQRYADRLNQINEFKKTLTCKKCGETRYYLFDFHHRDPSQKDFAISDRSRTPLPQLLEEMSKCDVLCANCHREWHYLSSHSLCNNYDEWLLK